MNLKGKVAVVTGAASGIGREIAHRARYPVLVHRAADLLHAFFRSHLAMMPLRFANPSPSSGWIEDFHLQAVVHTRHT